MKIIQGILIGALFSGIVSAVYACYVALTSNTTSSFGLRSEDFWWLAAVLGGIAGLILGAVVGAIVSGWNLNLILGGLVGLLITGIPGLLSTQVSEGKFDEDHIRFGIALIFIEIVTGIVVSLALRLFYTKE